MFINPKIVLTVQTKVGGHEIEKKNMSPSPCFYCNR